jgi:peptidoglycan/xylan/chitin deacetylase (PgdA/CDA1 family)
LPVSQHPDADILAMVKLFKYFKTHEKEDFLNKVNSLLSVSEWHEYNRKYDSENVLSGEDIRNMSNDPLVHFGSHGYNHYILSTLSEEQINFEQTESKRIIFKLTGKETNSYCYPNGKKTDFPHNIGVLTEQNGYKTGFTTLHDKYRELTLPFEIPRFPLSYRALPGLFLKLL